MKMENQYQAAQTAPSGSGCNHSTTTLFPAHVMWNIDSAITQNHPFDQAAALNIRISWRRDHRERDRWSLLQPWQCLSPAQLRPSSASSRAMTQEPAKKNHPSAQKPPCHAQDPITFLASLRHPCSPSLWLAAGRRWRSSAADP